MGDPATSVTATTTRPGQTNAVEMRDAGKYEAGAVKGGPKPARLEPLLVGNLVT